VPRTLSKGPSLNLPRSKYTARRYVINVHQGTAILDGIDRGQLSTNEIKEVAD